MLPAKPWRAEPTARLVMSVFVCVFAGSVLSVLLRVFLAGGPGVQRPAVFVGLAALSLSSLAASLFLIYRRTETKVPTAQLLFLLGTFYVGLSAGALAHTFAQAGAIAPWQLVVTALSFQGASLGLVQVFLREHGSRWSEAFGFGEGPRRAVVLGVVAVVCFLPVGWGLQQLSAVVLTYLPGMQPEEQETVKVLREVAGWQHRLLLALVTVLLAPVAEEILFRGILYPWLKGYGYPRAAAWGVGFLFALIHFNAMTLLPLLMLAMLLTWLYEHTGNLLAPMAAHSVFNGLNFVMLYALNPG